MSMDVKVIENAIVFGDFHEDGVFSSQYEITADKVNTEQKVLAWVYHLCTKAWIDKFTIKSFIDRCVILHNELDVFTKD